MGIYDALNKGIDKANGEIIGFLHSDDLFYNSKVLKKIIDNFKKYDLDGIYGDLEYVEKINTKKVVRYWESCTFKYKLLRKRLDATPSYIISQKKYLFKTW